MSERSRNAGMVITIKNSKGQNFILNTDEWPELHSEILHTFNPDKSESKMWLKTRFQESTPSNLLIYFGYRCTFDKEMVFNFARRCVEQELDASLDLLEKSIAENSEKFFGNDAHNFGILRKQFLESLPVVL